MPDLDLASFQPIIFLAATALIVAVAWSLIRGAVLVAVGVAIFAGVVYAGLWWATGQQPVVPSEFGAWLESLPDTLGAVWDRIQGAFGD